MRSEYLWEFAYLLHIPSSQVDVLRYWDFLQYIIGIDAYREASKPKPGEGQ